MPALKLRLRRCIAQVAAKLTARMQSYFAVDDDTVCRVVASVSFMYGPTSLKYLSEPAGRNYCGGEFFGLGGWCWDISFFLVPDWKSEFVWQVARSLLDHFVVESSAIMKIFACEIPNN